MRDGGNMVSCRRVERMNEHVEPRTSMSIAKNRFTLAFFAGVILLAAVSLSAAIEFKPYPVAQITEAQWTSYYEHVRSAHGADRQDFPDQRLIVFHDKAAATSYAFTQPGHAAHPAWITRKIVQRGTDFFVDQIGYFAGQEAPFAILFRQYQALNERMTEQLKQQPAEVTSNRITKGAHQFLSR
jgi:hypothetical protein